MNKPESHKLNSVRKQPIEIRLLLLALCHKPITRWIQIVIVLFHISAFAFSEQGKLFIFNDYKEFSDAVAFIDTLSDFLLVTINIYQIISLTKSTAFVEIFSFISKKNFNSVKREGKNFRNYILILRLLPILPICIGTYIHLGLNVEQYFVSRDIWYYTIHMVVCSAVCLLYQIKETFNYMNDNLEELCNVYPISFNKADDSGKLRLKSFNLLKLESQVESLMDITNDYTILCNLLDKFNQYSKAPLVMMVMCTIVTILLNVTVIIQYAIKTKIFHSFDKKILVLTQQLIIAASSMGQAAAAAFVGESLEEEGQRTIQICYTLLNKLDKDAKIDTDNVIRKEVNFLLDQSKSRNIYMKAGGFFKLNWGILGSVASTVTTYSIVIIQFLLK